MSHSTTATAAATAVATPYGLLAEFDSETALEQAAHRVRTAGYSKTDAYMPYPNEAVIHALGAKRSKVPLIVLLGGIAGAITGYALQYWTSVVDYPLNVGGRPYHSWVSFIVVTFELTILFGALSGLIGMLALNRLPQPYHPVFNVPAFAAASRDGFFLVIEAGDARYDRQATEDLLREIGATDVWEVAP